MVPRPARTSVATVVALLLLAGSAAQSLVTVGSVDTLLAGEDLLVDDGLAYVAGFGVIRDGLVVFDVGDPENPVEIAALDDRFAVALERRGSLLYVAASTDGLWIADLVDRRRPVEIGHLPTAGTSLALALVGHFAYVAEGRDGLRVVDVSDPRAPVEAGRMAFPGEVDDVVAVGRTLYVANRSRGLRILDVSEPLAPVELGLFEQPTIRSVSVDGGVALVGAMSGQDGVLRLVDVSDPASPTQLSAIPGPFCGVRQGDRLLSCRRFTLEIYDVSDLANPVLQFEMFRPPGDVTAAIALDGDLAYMTSSQVPWGLRILDLSRLERPAVVGAFPGGTSGRRDVVVDEPIAFVVDGFRLESFDVSDPTAPVSLADTPLWAQSIELEGERLYMADPLAFGLRIVDVGDPANPVEIGQLREPGFRPTDVVVDGSFAYVSNRVIDVSDPTNPIEVARLPGAAAVEVADGVAYVSNGFSGLLVVDVSDPLAPRELDSRRFFNAAPVDIEVEGRLAYVGFSNGEFRIFDASDPSNLVEIAFARIGGVSSVVEDVEVRDGIVFLGISDGGVRVFDATDPTAPLELGGLLSGVRAVALVGPRVYAVGPERSGILEFGAEYLPRLPVEIDIRPLDGANRVNPMHPGLLPIAVLGSSALAAGDVDRRSVRFGPGLAQAQRFAPRIDVDRDRIRDRLFAFRNRETGIAPGDLTACLRGRTREGRRLGGCDVVRVEMCGRGFASAALLLPPIVIGRRLRRRRRPRT